MHWLPVSSRCELLLRCEKYNAHGTAVMTSHIHSRYRRKLSFPSRLRVFIIYAPSKKQNSRKQILHFLKAIIGSATPKINVKQSGRLVVVLIVLNGSNTLALTNPRDRCSFSGNCFELRSKVECALNRFKSPEPLKPAAI